MLLVRPEKSQNESSPNFSNFCPGFCPEFLSEFSPNFLRSFRALFRGKRRPEKIHQKSPPFFKAKFPGKYEKNIHKIFLERTQSNYWLGQEVQHERLCSVWHEVSADDVLSVWADHSRQRLHNHGRVLQNTWACWLAGSTILTESITSEK